VEEKEQGVFKAAHQVVRYLSYLGSGLLVSFLAYVLSIGPVLLMLHRGLLRPTSSFFSVARAVYRPVFLAAAANDGLGSGLEGYFHLWGHVQLVPVQLNEIYRDRDHVVVGDTRRTTFGGVSGGAVLVLYFRDPSSRGVDVSFGPTLQPRRIRLMDGTKLIAEAQIRGGAWKQELNGERRKGLMLSFDSLTEAERIAGELWNEDEETYLLRKAEEHFKDKRGWQ